MSYQFPNFEIGDHLTVPLAGMKFGQHHGIYVGDDMVIHFTGDDGATATLVKEMLGAFANGRWISVIPYTKSDRPRWKVVQDAEMKLRDSASYPPYSIWTNNCEHFVNLCKTGKKTSTQASELNSVIEYGSQALFGEENKECVAILFKGLVSYLANYNSNCSSSASNYSSSFSGYGARSGYKPLRSKRLGSYYDCAPYLKRGCNVVSCDALP